MLYITSMHARLNLIETYQRRCVVDDETEIIVKN